jgi:hypothetical protein
MHKELTELERRILVFLYCKGYVDEDHLILESSLIRMMEKEGIPDMTDEQFVGWIERNLPKGA